MVGTASAEIRLVSVPIPSYVHTETSPALKKIGGFLAELAHSDPGDMYGDG